MKEYLVIGAFIASASLVSAAGIFHGNLNRDNSVLAASNAHIGPKTSAITPTTNGKPEEKRDPGVAEVETSIATRTTSSSITNSQHSVAGGREDDGGDIEREFGDD